MPRYKVSFTSREGKRESAYVEGPSVDWVEQHLAGRGASDVKVHWENILSVKGRNLAAEGKIAPGGDQAVHRQGAIKQARNLGIALAFAFGFWALGLPAIFNFAAIVAVAQVVVAFATIPPAWINEAIERALVWHEWTRVLRLLLLLAYNPTQWRPALRFNRGRQRARALVGLGRVEEGLSELEAAGKGSGLEPAQLMIMRSSLLILARRYEEAIALRREALATNPKSASDVAIAMLRYGGDVEEARAVLAAREGAKIHELERIFYGYAQGLLALADGRFADALARLDASRAVTAAEIGSPARRFGLEAILDAHRVLALASLGETDRAGAVLAPIEGFLVASDEALLLARCREAIARGQRGYR